MRSVIDSPTRRRPLSFLWKVYKGAAESPDSFVSRSVGGRYRTKAALASKCALVNKEGRCHRMSSICLLLVGELISHIVNQNSFELAVSLCNALHTSMHLQASSFINHPRRYLSNSISSTARYTSPQLFNYQLRRPSAEFNRNLKTSDICVGGTILKPTRLSWTRP